MKKGNIILVGLVIFGLLITIGGNYVLSAKTYEITSDDNTMVSFAKYHSGNVFRAPYYTYEELSKTIILRNTNMELKQQLYFKEIIKWNNSTVTEYVHGPFELTYYDTYKIISLFVHNVTIKIV